MADKKPPNKKVLSWPVFDAIVAAAPLSNVNPWQPDGSFRPDYTTLCQLLGVPLYFEADVRSGVPALALDVWVAYELRRAGLERDWVWPRAESPRVVSRDVLRFIHSLPADSRNELLPRLTTGSNAKTTSASAYLLGNHYVKQVDVVMSSWETGPEILISTKRMDSSFGNNAFNRIEESYGDAKNLRLRYPSAAVGFLYALRSTAWDKKPKPGEAGIADRIVDLVSKLQREPDAYHACCVLVPEYTGPAPKEKQPEPEEDEDSIEVEPGAAEEDVEQEVDVDVAPIVAALPAVKLRQDYLDDASVDPGHFFKTIMDTVLTNTPVSYHRHARDLRRNPVTAPKTSNGSEPGN